MMNGRGCAWALSGQCARVYTPRALMSFYYKSPHNPRPLLIAAVTAKNMPHQYRGTWNLPKPTPLNKLPSAIKTDLCADTVDRQIDFAHLSYDRMLSSVLGLI